jgi:transcriptional regulator with XRE-family HTH domain
MVSEYQSGVNTRNRCNGRNKWVGLGRTGGETTGGVAEALVDSIRQRLIGGALQQTRKLMGNSQAEMGGVLHVSREQVSDYESGKRELRAGDLERLAEWWEIPLPTLMVRLGYKLPTEWPTFEDWLRQRENIRQNMQGASGETTTTDAVLAAEAARKRGRMPYSDAGSASYAYSHP